jgi:hypothetical protein
MVRTRPQCLRELRRRETVQVDQRRRIINDDSNRNPVTRIQYRHPRAPKRTLPGILTASPLTAASCASHQLDKLTAINRQNVYSIDYSLILLTIVLNRCDLPSFNTHYFLPSITAANFRKNMTKCANSLTAMNITHSSPAT